MPRRGAILSIDTAHVDTPTGPTIPRWITIREASLITGLPEDTLQRCVDQGIVASDHVLSDRLGVRFVFVDTDDLVKTGLLRRSEVPDDRIAAVLSGREHVDVVDLESPNLTVRPEPPVPVPIEPARVEQSMALPEWVTLREASFITGLSEQFLRRQVDGGLIASHSLGRRRASGYLLLRSADLERALRAGEDFESEDEFLDADAKPPAPAPVLIAQPGEIARTTNPTLRVLRRAALWTVLSICVLTLLLVTLPLAFGYHSAAVTTDDMEPAFHVGDLVIAKTVAPTELRPNDVVSFRDPADPDRLIIHRVQSVDPSDGTVLLSTKPDGGGSMIEWSVPEDGKVGKVSRRFGRFGHVLTFVQSRVGQVVLIITPLLALGLLILIKSWRRPVRPVEADPAAS